MHCDLEILEDLVLNKLCSSDPNIDSVNILEEWISVAQKCKEKFHINLLNQLFEEASAEIHFEMSARSGFNRVIKESPYDIIISDLEMEASFLWLSRYWRESF